jgi:hypothetical protein
MKILITENQLNVIEDRISKDQLMSYEPEDQLDIEVYGVYKMNDIDKFYNDTPYTMTTNQMSKQTNWKHITAHHPVVILKIPYNTAKLINKTSPFYKDKTEAFSKTSNELFIILINRYEDKWIVSKTWNKKRNIEQQKIFDNFRRNDITELGDYLTRLSFFKKYTTEDIINKINSILNNIPKTSNEDNVITDGDIDSEFREPIRFTLRNGEDPKPIIDKIIKKYGRLSTDINRMVYEPNDKFQLLKHRRPNPYLNQP